MIVGIQSFNSQVFCQGFLSKSLFTISWVMRVYICVCKRNEKGSLLNPGREFCGSLTSWPSHKVTRKIQPR